MKTVLRSLVVVLTLLLPLASCAPTTSSKVVDVSADGRFQAGYQVGQLYRTKTDGYLVLVGAEGSQPTRELWTPASYEQGKNDLWTGGGGGAPAVTKIPAGSVMRIDRLQYSYGEDHPVTPGGPITALCAYGTLTPMGGQACAEVVAPVQVGTGRLVANTTVEVYDAPAAFLEKVDAGNKN